MGRILVALAGAAAMTLGMVGFQSTASAGDSCFMCTSASTGTCAGAQYCKSKSGTDTSDDRKHCKDQGCDINGFTSCPTSSGYKVCSAATFTPIDGYESQDEIHVAWWLAL
jgi:hypothetical protein